MKLTQIKALLLLVILVQQQTAFGKKTPAVEKAKRLVAEINARQNSTWKARLNKSAVGLKPPVPTTAQSAELEQRDEKELEKFINYYNNFSSLYDKHLSRIEDRYLNGSWPRLRDTKAWHKCVGKMTQAWNQGDCNSCTINVAASLMSDRLCMASDGTDRTVLSVQDVIDCCESCNGCNAGVALSPFMYWYEKDFVSELNHPSTVDKSCGSPCPFKAYYPRKSSPKCAHRDRHVISKLHLDYFYAFNVKTKGIITENDFVNHGPRRTFASANILDLIKTELDEFGPMLMTMVVTESFLHYYEGVYDFIPNDISFGKHVIKVFDYGKYRRPDGSEGEYLAAVNSWSNKWGMKGTVKFDFDAVEKQGYTFVSGIFQNKHFKSGKKYCKGD